MAHVLYYIAIREIGVALSQTLQLLLPCRRLGTIGRGFSANASLTRNFGALAILLLARSSPRELNRKLSLNPLKTSDWKGRTAGPSVEFVGAPGGRVLELNKPAHVWI